MADNFFDEWFGSFLDPVNTLDKAWRDACMSGNFTNYERQKKTIKQSGKKVYRNSQGRHKVV